MDRESEIPEFPVEVQLINSFLIFYNVLAIHAEGWSWKKFDVFIQEDVTDFLYVMRMQKNFPESRFQLYW